MADSSVTSSPANRTRRAGSVAMSARSADPLSSGRVDSSITSLPSRAERARAAQRPGPGSVPGRGHRRPRRTHAHGRPDRLACPPPGRPGCPPTASATLIRTSASSADSASLRIRSAPISWPCEPISVATSSAPLTIARSRRARPETRTTSVLGAAASRAINSSAPVTGRAADGTATIGEMVPSKSRATSSDSAWPSFVREPRRGQVTSSGLIGRLARKSLAHTATLSVITPVRRSTIRAARRLGLRPGRP